MRSGSTPSASRKRSSTAPPGKLEIDGATGHLTLGESRVFAREGQLMRLRDGRVEVVAPR